MKIYSISDLHGNLEGLDPQDSDIVIIAGDVAPMKGWSIWHINDQVKWMNKRFASWCMKSPNAEFVVIPGNHDLFAQRSDVPTKLELPGNVHFLVDQIVGVKGLRIAGSPWIPPISRRWAYETDGEEDLARHFAWIPEGVDILVTHTPPRVDGWNVDVSLQSKSPHFGSRALADAIKRVKPKLVFCGHIHTGDHRVHDLIHDDGRITKLYNVSRLNEDYDIEYEPMIEYVCREEDMVEITVELEDDLVEKAKTRLCKKGIALEQALLMFLEEFVRTEGDVHIAVDSGIARIARAKVLTHNLQIVGQ